MSGSDFENRLRNALAQTEANAPEREGMDDRLVQTVTTGGRRRRRVALLRTGWIPPLLAAATVIVVVALGVAIGTSGNTDGIRPATRPPTTAPTHTSITDTPATTASGITPTKPPSTSHTRAVTSRPAIGRWTDSNLMITEKSLGAVTRGMTFDQAQAAAGVSLAQIGDGINRPTKTTIGGSTLIQFAWATTCFDATRTRGGQGTRVTTPAGVALGDPMTRILSAYGAAAAPFTADPTWTGAGNLPAGILVQFNDGVLLFIGSSADKRGGTITSIRGAPDARTASSLLC